MDISGLTSVYTEKATQSAQNSKLNSLENTLKNADKSESTDEELMSVCKEFEAYFMEQVFKGMKSAMVPESESTDSASKTLKNYYEDNLMTEYAKSASDQMEGSNSLAQMLYEQMKRNI